ncbi:MAG: isoprenyl transferase [Coriobacteriales bacterium]|nr:isoprenyl transferase [Coriobacteriales bacterium]
MEQLRTDQIPRHIAIVMDGNGRWAKARGESRSFGHAAGVEALREVITAAVRLGVGALTVYAFSTENWNRPQEEVDLLMSLFATTLIKELPLLMRENVRLVYLGDMEALPIETKETFEQGLSETNNNTGMVLAVAVNYGSRAEILRAVRQISDLCCEGKLSSSEITADMFSRYLYTAEIGDPDLLIRTSGEKRLSNFLLWQCAYTEFYFDEVLWPDFNRWNLIQAILTFQHRERRFGGVKDGLSE